MSIEDPRPTSELQTLAMQQRGIVLVTGATGSEKSTTLRVNDPPHQ